MDNQKDKPYIEQYLLFWDGSNTPHHMINPLGKIPTHKDWQIMKQSIDEFYSLHTEHQIFDYNYSIDCNFSNLTSRDKDRIKNIVGQQAFIYILSSGTGIYKIGVSKYPETRLKTHQTSSPLVLKLIHSKKFANKQVAYMLENKILKKYINRNNEWLILSDRELDQVIYYIDNHSGDYNGRKTG